MFLGVLLVAAAGSMVPSVAEAVSCDGAAAPCAEDPAIDNCTQCHSMRIQGGNRNGSDRQITVSAASNRHILGPPMSSWLATVQGMIGKGGTGDAARTAAYLDTNYAPCAPSCGPIMSSPTISDAASDGFTVSWITSGNGFGDLPATSCVLYGTSTSPTGNTCTPSDPSYDPNSGNLVTNHSVTLTGLNPLTTYYVYPQSVASGNTTTYAAASDVTTLPDGGGGGGGGALGIIVSLTVGDYNNDNNLDIGVAISSKNHVIAYMGDGDGGFSVGQTLSNVGTTPSAVTSGGVQADFNEDGNDDIAVALFGAESDPETRRINVFLGTSPSGFETTPVSDIALGAPPTGVATGDFDEDGVLDLAVATVEVDGSLGHLIIFPGAFDTPGQGNGDFLPALNTYELQVSTAVGPTITSIVPDPVDCTGLPTNLTLTGTLLLGTANVTLDGMTPLTIVSSSPDFSTMVVELPVGATAGPHSIVVTVGALPPGSMSFTVAPRTVTISSVSPSSKVYGVSPSGPIDIVGTNFQVGATVTVGSLSGTAVAGSIPSASIPFVRASSTLIRAWVPNTALALGSHDVSVENTDDCAGSATLAGGFTMTAPQPTVSSLSLPNVTYGITPSQQITITGTNFVAGAVIDVGGLSGATVPGSSATAGVPFVYVSSSQLRFYWNNTSVSPGTYPVEVTNPSEAGGLGAVLAGGFNVAAPQPTVTSLTPSSVTYGVSASQSVTISGTNFVLGSTITVGGLTGTTVSGSTATAGNPFVWVSGTTLRFWWANTSLPLGAYEVQVTNPSAAGGLSGSLASGFQVLAAQPTVTSVAPASVTYGVSASSQITITGSNFVVGATVTVGTLSGPTVSGSSASAGTPFVHLSSGQIRFWWPNTSLAPGTYSVQVANPALAGGLQSTLAAGFTVVMPQPTISSLSPNSGTYGVSPSTQLTVTGTNFVVGAQVTLGSLSGPTVNGSSASAGTPFVHVSSGQIRIWWPNTSLAPGVYSLQVANPAAAGSLSGTLASAFTVNTAQPTVTSATPSSVTYGVSPSTQVTIVGTNFVSGATVTVGSLTGDTVPGSSASVGVPFVHVSSGQIRFWWPNTSLAPGAYAVQVSNPAESGGLSGTLASGFTVNTAQPTVTSATPASVTWGVSPSTQVTIAGTNFVSGATVTVGSLTGPTVPGSSASVSVPFVHVSSTQIRFWWPNTSLSAGSYAVTVTNPAASGGLGGTLAAGFVVTAPAPSISSVTPATVTFGGASQQVTIAGGNFALGATITVGTLSGPTVSGSNASVSVPYVWLTSSQLRFWWPSTSLPAGTYDVVVTNPSAGGGLTTTSVGGFVVQ
jgi:hypothetical protein